MTAEHGSASPVGSRAGRKVRRIDSPNGTPLGSWIHRVIVGLDVWGLIAFAGVCAAVLAGVI